MALIDLVKAVEELEKEQHSNLMFKINKAKADSGDSLIKIEDLVKRALENGNEIENGIEKLSDRLAGVKYKPEHFGRVAMIKLSSVYSNVNIQRIVEDRHIGKNILPIFDPRITQPINVVYYPAGAPHPITGEILSEEMYTAWDGQQTSSTVESLIRFGLVEVDAEGEFLIKANIIDYDLEVPGSSISGEAVANFGFRTINGSKAKKAVDPYYVMRSEYNGKKMYNSDLQEDVHSYQMWTTMEKYQMLPAPTTGTDKKLPGHVAHVSGMKTMASHDTENFDIATFENVMKFLSTYFNKDNGINSSFYMAMAELFQLIKDQNVAGFNEQQFASFIKAKYGNGDGFSSTAKARLHNLQVKLGAKKSWSDACSVPYLIDDYVNYCEENNLKTGPFPMPAKMSEYVNIVEKA
jgi:hypothetical protein